MKPIQIIGVLLASAVAGLMVSITVHGPQLRATQLAKEVTRNTYHNPLSFVTQLKQDPKAGEKIVHAFCETCHGREPLIEIRAPRTAKEWAPYKRLAKQQLLALTKKGVGAMPARGGCFECSDEQLTQAIDYLLNQ